jgi:hypothetical protein
MSVIMPLPQAAAGSVFEPLLRLWMMPVQIGLEMMESSMAMMASTYPHAPVTAHKGEADAQDIARAAEEQAAHLDDGPDTIVLPAALIA